MSSPIETQAKTESTVIKPIQDDATLPVSDVNQNTEYEPSYSLQHRGPVELPASFGRYELQKLLGAGGMGTVFLAHDLQLDRPVALKIPLFSEKDGADILERFKQEARSAATIHHANVCPLYDIGEFNGVPYLTMAFIDGKPLSEYIAANPLTHRQIASLICKLALALQEAHTRGVIHRDLKPGNIMMDKRSEPLIMDFGLARRTQKKETRLTQEGTMLGTPVYMPPEQVAGKVSSMGAACDIYSLGVILYELLAGRLPFLGDSKHLLPQIMLDNPPPPSRFAPDLELRLEAICLKAMAKKPVARFASMSDFAKALQDYLQADSLDSSSSLLNETRSRNPDIVSPLTALPAIDTKKRDDPLDVQAATQSMAALPTRFPSDDARVLPESTSDAGKNSTSGQAPIWLLFGFLLLLALVMVLVFTR